MLDTGNQDSREHPLNREPIISDLVKSFLTPTSIAFDRNHGPIPDLSASNHTVRVVGKVPKPITLDIAALQSLPQHTVTCALQCAGNRRHSMRTNLKEVEGLDWEDGAVMNCAWRGPLLRDVLQLAGLDVSGGEEGGGGPGPTEEAGWHVSFSTQAQATQEDSNYSASIPLGRAVDPTAQVLLALEANGAALTPKHGAPVRIIAPGVAGARSVKWVDEISVQDHESEGVYQQRDYKILPPEATDKEAAERFWDSTPSLQDMPLNSAIGSPASGTKVERDKDGRVLVTGYALPSGDDGPVTKVQVSGDNGETWTDADLVKGAGKENGRWSWCLWSAKVEIEPGPGRNALSRAMDRTGRWQEESCQWNLRGVAYSGYGEAKDLTVL